VENLDEKLKYEIITELGLLKRSAKMDGRALLQKRRTYWRSYYQKEKNDANAKSQQA